MPSSSSSASPMPTWTETTPLVADSAPEGRPQVHIPKVHDPGAFVLTVCGLILLGASSSGLWAIPAIRLVEDIACRTHYGLLDTVSPIDEGLCKADEIQERVAYILAVYTAIQATVGATCTFPWGIVADKIGRRPVLSIAVIGITLDLLWFAFVCAFPRTLPLEAIWLGPAMEAIGGGNAVLTAALFSMVSDVVTEEKRTTAFMRAYLSGMLGNLVAPAVSGQIMDKVGPWFVVRLAIGGFLLLAIAVHILPEVKPASKEPQDHMAEQAPSKHGVVGAIEHAVVRIRESLAVFQSPSLVLLLLSSLAVFPLAQSTMQLMSQFASKRYHISLAQTGYLSSLYGFATAISILWILPAVASFLAAPARIPNSRQRDLFLIRASSVVLLIGSSVMSTAPNLGTFILGLAILSLGAGWGSHLRSLATIYVDAAHRTRLYSIMSIVETVGNVYAQPMLAALFTAGMKLGHFWIGLPYLGIALLVALALALLLLVRLPSEDADEE